MGNFSLIVVLISAVAACVFLVKNTHLEERYVEVKGGIIGERYYEIDDVHDDKPPTKFDLVDAETAPETMLTKILYGYHIMLDTKQHCPDYAGNSIDCNCCHFNGGNTLGGKNRGISLVGVTAMYPKFSKRENKDISLSYRLNNCFMRSLNGKPLPEGGYEMEALLAYLNWISHEVMDAPMLPWLGLPPIVSDHKPDPINGEAIYATSCAACHGTDGTGNPGVPAIFGPNSFNDGAGMNTMPALSSFVLLNMPYGQADLTPEEALDVAAYVITCPRPHFTAPK